MRKLKKYYKTFICLCLSVVLVFSTVFCQSNVKAFELNLIENSSLILKNLKLEEVEEIESIKSKCLTKGKQVALELNELNKSDKKKFEKQLRQVLDLYYSTPKSQRDELEKFEDNIDDSANKIVENYKEAERERDSQKELSYETGKVTVSFKYGTSYEKIDEIMTKESIKYEVIDDGEIHIAEDINTFRKKRLEKIQDWKSDIIVLAEIKLEDTVERAKNKFEKYDCVVSATDNILFEAEGTISTNYTATTDDTLFNEDKQWNLEIVDVPRAWHKFKSVETIYVPRIAVIDCGVQMNHKELKGLLLTSKSVDVTQNNKKLIDCKDEQSKTGQYTGDHGTSVASVLAAKGNNKFAGAGIASIANTWCKNSFEIMAIKCDETVNRDKHITKAYLAKAINYAVSNGADIINISYSAPKADYNSEHFKAVETAVKKAIAADICVVCSAGNSYNDDDGKQRKTVRYPAGFSGVIGVGATWKNGNLADYSNESDAVDIVAPGGYTNSNGAQILVATPTSKGYGYSHGTSYATPLVAGTIAMMMSINCTLTPAQYLSRLQNRSTSTANGRVTNKKFKVLNAGKAVALMEEQ